MRCLFPIISDCPQMPLTLKSVLYSPQQIHTYLTDSLGIPAWGSYIIFALVTLFTGLLLGLVSAMFVCFVCFFPWGVLSDKEFSAGGLGVRFVIT